MARPYKIGLEYFPLDVDFFTDEKIQIIAAKYGELGEIILIKLLARIYRNGYYLKWDDDTALTFSASAGKNITNELVRNVIKEALKRNFFDTKLFVNEKIISSNGIQKRYRRICTLMKRKPDMDLRFLVNQNNSGIIPERSGIIPPKEKKRKVNKIKVNKSKLNKSDDLKIEKIIPDEKQPDYGTKDSDEAGKKLYRALYGAK